MKRTLKKCRIFQNRLRHRWEYAMEFFDADTESGVIVDPLGDDPSPEALRDAFVILCNKEKEFQVPRSEIVIVDTKRRPRWAKWNCPDGE